MPSTSTNQAALMRLAYFFKKHHRMPEGAGKASPEIKKTAKSMSFKSLMDYMHTKKKS